MRVVQLKYRAAIDEFHNSLKKYLGSNLQAIRIYGSVARGTADEESDIDVLVLLKDKSPSIKKEIYDLAFEVNLKFDVVLSPIIMAQEQYTNSLFKETLFYRNIQEEGVTL